MTTGAWETDLAKLISKKSGIQGAVGTTIGTVITTSPLKISILDGMVILQSDIHDIFLPDREGGNTVLRVGDQVSIIADSSDSIFFIIDKVKKA